MYTTYTIKTTFDIKLCLTMNCNYIQHAICYIGNHQTQLHHLNQETHNIILQKQMEKLLLTI